MLLHTSPGGLSYNVTLQETESPPGKLFIISSSNGGKFKSHHLGRKVRNHTKQKEYLKVTSKKRRKMVALKTKKLTTMAGKDSITYSEKLRKGMKAVGKDLLKELKKSGKFPIHLGFDKLSNFLESSVNLSHYSAEVEQHLTDIGKVTIDIGKRLLSKEKSLTTVSKKAGKGKNFTAIAQRLIAVGKKILSHGKKVANLTKEMHIKKSVANKTITENSILEHLGFFYEKGLDKTNIPSTINLPKMKMVSLCSHGSTHYGVTLRGGLQAGKFTMEGKMDSINNCIKRCCANQECNLVFMVRRFCYTVVCDNKNLCETVRARHAKLYQPRVVYLWRGIHYENSKRGHISSYIRQSKDKMDFQKTIAKSVKRENHPKSLKSKLRCKETIFTQVLTKGNFYFLGSLQKNLCQQSCCEIKGCNVALLIDRNCYALSCFEDSRGCPMIHGKTEIPHIVLPINDYPAALSWSPKLIRYLKNFTKKENMLRSTKADKVVEIKKRKYMTISFCPHSKLYSQVAFRQGKHTGVFLLIGKVKDINQCLRKCCMTSRCDVAFLLDRYCYVVRCYREALCHIVSSNHLKYKTQAIFVTKRFNKEKTWHRSGRPKFDQTYGHHFSKDERSHRPQVITKKLTVHSKHVAKQMKFKTKQRETSDSIDKNKLKSRKQMKELEVPGRKLEKSFPSEQFFPVQIKIDFDQSNAEIQKTKKKSMVTNKTNEMRNAFTNAQQLDIKIDFRESQTDSSSSYNGSTETGTSGDETTLSNVEAAGHSESPMTNETSPNSISETTSFEKNTSHAPFKRVTDQKCLAEKILHNVTLLGGYHSGTFKAITSAASMEECSKICCNSKNCDLVFVILRTCFMVNCYNMNLCKHTQARAVDIFHPRIVYVERVNVSSSKAKNIAQQKHSTENSSGNNKGLHGQKHVRNCSIENVLLNTTLRHGFNSGKFSYHPRVTHLEECAGRCCNDRECDVALIIGKRCFTVKCHLNRLCKTSYVKHSNYSPKVVFVSRTEANLSNIFVSNLTFSNHTINLFPERSIQTAQTRHSLSTHFSTSHHSTLTYSSKSLRETRLEIRSAPTTVILTTSFVPSIDVQIENSTQSVQTFLTNSSSGGEIFSRLRTEHLTETDSATNERAWQYHNFIKDKNEAFSKTEHYAEKFQKLNHEIKEVDKTSTRTRNNNKRFGNEEAPLSLRKRCFYSPELSNVTLFGGYGAGNFTYQPTVTDMRTCKKICCQTDSCNLAFIVQKKCYTVSCFSKTRCQAVKASQSERFDPRIVYITRSRSNNSFINGDESNTENEQSNRSKDNNDYSEAGNNTTERKSINCETESPLYGVTLKGGFRAGKFVSKGITESIDSCVALCCQSSTCDLAFMIQNVCFNVHCNNSVDCGPITAHNTEKYHPMIVYVRRSGEIEKLWKHSGELRFPKSKPDNLQTIDHKAIPTSGSSEKCQFSDVRRGFTLKQGAKAGTFMFAGKSADMEDCIKHCCHKRSCDVAMKLKQNCFLVKCRTKQSCFSVPAVLTEYHPMIAFRITGKGNIQILNS